MEDLGGLNKVDYEDMDWTRLVQIIGHRRNVVPHKRWKIIWLWVIDRFWRRTQHSMAISVSFIRGLWSWVKKYERERGREDDINLRCNYSSGVWERIEGQKELQDLKIIFVSSCCYSKDIVEFNISLSYV